MINRTAMLFPTLVLALNCFLNVDRSFAQEKPKAIKENEQKSRNFEEEFPTPFLQAIVQGYPWLVELMLKKGQSADVPACSEMRLTPILLATVNGKEDIVKILIKYHADIEAKDNHGANALMYACYRQNLGLVKILADAGANVNSRGDTGTTPLMIAANQGNRSISQFLLNHHADVNAKTDTGATPLMIAADDNDTITVLTETGAVVNDQDNAGWTALFHAIDKHQLKKIETLLRHGAKLDIADKLGLTPLLLAKKEQDPQIRASIIKLLQGN